MPVIVQKFGGSSVADVEKLRRVAAQVVACRRAGNDTVVVVSAMGKTTDGLLAQAHAVSPDPDRRELDMLLTVGERISMALLAMAIKDLGEQAISFTGSQSGIITTDRHADARIIEVRPQRIQDELARGRIVIVAGYQGVSQAREITTLGRGGSDTTAVALAAALNADRCEIYSDVDGVYTADPRTVPGARKLESLSHEEMQELAEAGARVLNAQAVEWARRQGIKIHARRTGDPSEGTVVQAHAPATPRGVRAVAHRGRVAWLDANNVEPARLLEMLVEHHAPADQVWVVDGGTRVLAALPLENLHGVDVFTRKLADTFAGNLRLSTDHGMVTLVGDGIATHHRILQRVLTELRNANIPVRHAFTGALRLSVLVPTEHVERAARLLHDATVVA